VAANRSHFVGPPPAQLPLEEVLPPISIDVPSVAAARQYTSQLRRLWPTDDAAVALDQAYRLLDADTLTDIVLAAMTRATAPDARFHMLPNPRALMPDLRGRVWWELLGERLVATGIKDDPVAGKRVAVSADRLRLLEPNWARSELHLDGHAVVFAVEVEHVTLAVPKTPQRKHMPEVVLRRHMEQIAADWPDDKPPSEARLRELVQGRGGWVGRDRVREAQKRYAPQWSRDRGRPSGGNSRK
jgi:hypothetical protein